MQQWIVGGIDMAKLLKSDLSIKTDFYTFNIRVRSGITIINGDSATGKSLFFEAFNKMEQDLRTRQYAFISSGTTEAFCDIVRRLHLKIVFVDNADVVVPATPETLRLIHKSDCQFIFLGRDVQRYDVDYDNVAHIVELNRNIFTLDYALMDGDKLWQ